jgi:hypothetical protein
MTGGGLLLLSAAGGVCFLFRRLSSLNKWRKAAQKLSFLGIFSVD